MSSAQPALASATGSRGPVRVVTAAALFDGHDASINIMRRLLQAQGAEVIHLGHDRSVEDVVAAVVQEDADAVAVSSYQGGHLEYFDFLVQRLREGGAGHVRVYGGGGGVISPEEVEALHAAGVTRIYRPEDGQRMGLEGMVCEMLEPGLSRPVPDESDAEPGVESQAVIARLISDRIRTTSATGKRLPRCLTQTVIRLKAKAAPTRLMQAFHSSGDCDPRKVVSRPRFHRSAR